MIILKNRIQKGFTLIELLIVIAVLGVLAAVVLAAINPLEQLKRGRDSGRLSGVAQIGHGMTALITNQNMSAPPTNAVGDFFATTDFQTAMKGAGELVNVITAPGTGSKCTQAAAHYNEGTYCYQTNNTDYNIWTGLESQSNKTKAACSQNQFAIAVYKSALGRAGIDCVANAGDPPTNYTTAFPNKQ